MEEQAFSDVDICSTLMPWRKNKNSALICCESFLYPPEKSLLSICVLLLHLFFFKYKVGIFNNEMLLILSFDAANITKF